MDEEERGRGDAGRRLDLGDDGADAVAEGGGLVKLRAEGLELRVHDGTGQPRRGLGVGGGGGARRSGEEEQGHGGGARRSPAAGKCVGGERERIFPSPLSSEAFCLSVCVACWRPLPMLQYS